MAGDVKTPQSGVILTTAQHAQAGDILGTLRAIRDTLRGAGRNGPTIALAVGLQGDDNFGALSWQRFHSQAIVFRSNGAGNVGIRIGGVTYTWRTPKSGVYRIPFYRTIERGSDVFEPTSGVPRTVEPTLIIGTPE